MKYPLKEKIGNPELLVGRVKEFNNFEKWAAYIPKRLAQSRVILARRKSGKTALVQRFFNQLWNENGEVIPFYLDIPELNVWFPNFAIRYYRAFASQLISFLERDEKLVREPLSLEAIREYGVSKSVSSFVRDVDEMFWAKKERDHDLMWETAHEAPHRFATIHDRRFLVILDEFQNISQYIYREEGCKGNPDESMPGSFHSLSESKYAPMLVTGSYVSWLTRICGKYLQAGRLDKWRIPPYLKPEDGLQAVYEYSREYDVPVTNETAILINRLCMSDPYFISCVIKSNYEDRDLSTEEGVINAVNYEITDRESRMSVTWSEYIGMTLHKINDRHAKSMLLHLSRYSDRYWTHRELKETLGLDLDLNEILKRLHLLVEADVIEWGSSDIQFRGLQDGTLNMILRNRFEEEISTFAPDLRQEFHEKIAQLQKEKKSLQGTLNNLSGQFAEYQLAMSFRSKKRFSLSEYFAGVQDNTRLNIIDVKQRVQIRRGDGKNMESDITAESDCGRIVVVEVKKQKTKIGKNLVEDFCEKLSVFSEQMPDRTILPAFLSLGGFTDEALRYCEENGIGTAECIAHF